MRRILPALLAFFGIACIAAAIAIPTLLVSQLKVVPLDLDITSGATTIPEEGATGERFPATIFDRCSVSEDRARTLDAHVTQQRRSVIVDPSDRRQATLQSSQTLRIDRYRDAQGTETEPSFGGIGTSRDCNDGLLTATIDRVSVDRKTSEPNGAISSLQMEQVPEGGDYEDVSVRIDDRQGFQYKFPFDVKKESYGYYDLNTRQNGIAEFFEEKEINGVNTYGFRSVVEEKDLSELPNPQGQAALGTMLNMPAEWWGITGEGIEPDDQISMHRHASAVRYVWVEPKTGIIVDGLEEQHQYFKSPDQSEQLPAPIRDFRMDAMRATFKWDERTVEIQSDNAKQYTGLLKLGTFWLPLILGIVGIALVALWVLLLLRGRKNGDDDDDNRRGGPDGDGPDGGEAATRQFAKPAAGATAAGAAGAAGAASKRGRDAPDPGTPRGGNPWERPTEQIPKVGGAKHADSDGDFRAVDDPKDPNR